MKQEKLATSPSALWTVKTSVESGISSPKDQTAASNDSQNLSAADKVKENKWM